MRLHMQVAVLASLLIPLQPAAAGVTAHSDYDYYAQPDGLSCHYGELGVILNLVHDAILGDSSAGPIEPNAVLWQCTCQIQLAGCTQQGQPSLTCNLPGQDDPTGTPYIQAEDGEYWPACPTRELPLNPDVSSVINFDSVVGFSPEEVKIYEWVAKELNQSLRAVLEPLAQVRCSESCTQREDGLRTDSAFIREHCSEQDEQGNPTTVNEEVCIGTYYCPVRRPSPSPTPSPEPSATPAPAPDAARLSGNGDAADTNLHSSAANSGEADSGGTSSSDASFNNTSSSPLNSWSSEVAPEQLYGPDTVVTATSGAEGVYGVSGNLGTAPEANTPAVNDVETDPTP